jgi:transcriptional regulator with XRE-family HTH domain
MGIKTLRKAAGLTQEALAVQLSYNRSTVAMWEAGKSKPRADKLPDLARILGCTVDDLLKEA